MDFCRQAAARTSDGLILSPFCAAGVLVGADELNDQVLKVRIAWSTATATRLRVDDERHAGVDCVVVDVG